VIVGKGEDAKGLDQPIPDVASLQALLAAGRELPLVVVRDQARIVLRWPQPNLRSDP
jgi:hypothetical protein